ncbi:MAG: UPF0182 family membrane protein [Geodermatophilaceae bacterium]
MRPPMPMPALSRRARVILGVIAVLVVVLSILGTLTSEYVDYLWFRETGYTSVFWTELSTRVVLFLVVGAATGLVVAGNLVLAYRLRPAFRPMSLEQQNLERYRAAIEPRRKLLLIGIGVVMAVFAGFTAQGSWQTWLLWRNGTDFGVVDPQFGVDVSFFAFDYPFYRLVLGFLFAIVLLSLAGAAAVHYVFGGIRLQSKGDRFSSGARMHLSVLLGAFVLLKAFAYYLDRFGLVFSDRNGITTGASYTDVTALLPAKTILLFVAAICAIAFFANIFFRNFALPALALVLLIVSSLAIGGAYPAIVQQFIVKPNANVREAPYITRNIEATRAAYGIDNVAYQPYEGETTLSSAELRDDQVTLPNARLLDPNVLTDTFTQLQQIRNVYGFPEKLDIDRYTIDGQVQDYVVGVRELDSSALTGNQTNWINQHLVFTHGNGFVAAPANRVVSEDGGGQPNFTTRDLPTVGDIDVDQSGIYYGELLTEYSVVGALPGAPPSEFDRPAGGEGDEDLRSTYDGEGGVEVGSFFKQLAFAVFYRERNFLLSGALNENSKVLYVRDPRDRVEKAAPFLQVDGDPYPAVVDGRIVWIVDGYTTLEGYPYSQQQVLGEVARDSLTGQGTAALPDQTINYIRNSVKATVDAYDGTVTLYEFDTEDPVLQTWMKTFPDIVSPESEISDELRSHFRYPEDLFKIQRELITQYHVSDPIDFFGSTDFWEVPNDPQQDDSSPAEEQPPFYILAARPGENEATFQLTSALNALERQNLSAFVSVSGDPDTYGEFQVLRLPGNTAVQGPTQVQNSFNSNELIARDLNLFNSENSQAVFGNLLTLPVAGGLLYISPLYVEGAGENSYPLLRKVLVNYNGQVAYEDTLALALDALFGPGAGEGVEEPGGTPTTPPSSGTPTTTPPTGTSAPPTDVITPEQAIADLDDAVAELDAAYESGDFVRIGEAQQALQDALAAYLAASGGGTPATTTATSTG